MSALTGLPAAGRCYLAVQQRAARCSNPQVGRTCHVRAPRRLALRGRPGLCAALSWRPRAGPRVLPHNRAAGHRLHSKVSQARIRRTRPCGCCCSRAQKSSRLRRDTGRQLSQALHRLAAGRALTECTGFLHPRRSAYSHQPRCSKHSTNGGGHLKRLRPASDTRGTWPTAAATPYSAERYLAISASLSAGSAPRTFLNRHRLRWSGHLAVTRHACAHTAHQVRTENRPRCSPLSTSSGSLPHSAACQGVACGLMKQTRRRTSQTPGAPLRLGRPAAPAAAAPPPAPVRMCAMGNGHCMCHCKGHLRASGPRLHVLFCRCKQRRQGATETSKK